MRTTSFEVAKALAQARSYGRCEGCGFYGGLDPHHRMTRGSGGVHGDAEAASNNIRNLLMLCRVCHDTTLNDAQGCIAIGWVIERRSGTDPLETPALIHTVNGYGWWYLTEDGGYRWADEMNLADRLGFCEHGIPLQYCGNCHETKIENNQEETAWPANTE